MYTDFSQRHQKSHGKFGNHAVGVESFSRTIGNSSYRQNFDLGKNNNIHHHSWKEHVKISKIAKFGCEML
jgi:hypothetical protein